MKYLGINYGTKRIGVAISDYEASFAFPKEILDTGSAIDKIVELVDQENIGAIVIGESRATNGESNDLGGRVAAFTTKLAEKVSIPISPQREDFSTVEAHRYQTAAGNRDDSAAAIILQRFLDKNKK